ncbi:histone-lysine N-methyltransferase ATX2 [Trifolium pratense]|uniref:Histone-lysine N-methyltransferase ATX2 n=1 Tax=Trifolium pratense TaxID=57577 RepID=A0A2K3NB13_TRIPR|nr:histone-lysine N-methyltransferase ATX2 [Trifolium pratense]
MQPLIFFAFVNHAYLNPLLIRKNNHICYLPLNHLYSSTPPCMSKKVKARKRNNEIQFNNCEIDSLIDDVDDKTMCKMTSSSTMVYAKPLVLYVYSRRRKKSMFPTSNSERTVLTRRTIGSNELESIGIDWNALRKHDGPRSREC